MESKFGWSDNKMTQLRRTVNYECNLKQHDRNRIPWRCFTSVRTPYLANTKKDDHANDDDEEEQEESLLLDHTES